ncbi:hypothetical protein D9M72_415770 [compost metagenome]
MMNAMAPKAPTGATRITQPMILKKSSSTVSRSVTTGRQRSRPTTTMAAPKNTEKQSTCNRLLEAKAPTTLVGMMPSRNAPASLGGAVPVLALRASWDSVFGSMFRPAPGWTILPTTRPNTRAKSVAPVKYSSAFTPTRPTAFTSPTAEMPVTITRKISGAMIILISWMKPSPSGRRAEPRSGQKWPTPMPRHTAARIWKKSDL